MRSTPPSTKRGSFNGGREVCLEPNVDEYYKEGRSATLRPFAKLLWTLVGKQHSTDRDQQ